MESIQYPFSAIGTQQDIYFDRPVSDPYRWLEDDRSEETGHWVQAQNAITEQYLSSIPYRNSISTRLAEMWNYPKYSSPFKEGDYYYFFKNDGLQNQAVMYRQKGLDGEPSVFLDPNKLSQSGTVALGAMSFSENANYFAFSLSKAGSDWSEGFIMDTATGQLLAEKLEWLKFTGFAWKGEEGFYYSRYPEPNEETRLSGQNRFHTVYYHKVGDPQIFDSVIYEDSNHPLRYHFASITEDKRFLAIHISEGTSGVELLVKDLTAENPVFKTLVRGFDHEAELIENEGPILYLRTNIHAPNYCVVAVDYNFPASEKWGIIIPENKDVLENAATGGGYLFASYLKDASSKVFQYNMAGEEIREVPLPGICTASGFGGKKRDTEFFYSYSSFTQPNTICRYNTDNGQSTLFRTSEVNFDTSVFETKQLFFTSKDGTTVPLFISYKKGLVLNGNNALLLYGYGGFNVSLTPAFSISNLFFMEQGGVYAQVSLRGGAEYGEDWHKAGMLHKKQNVFDDFIGAATFLIKEGYTSTSKLAMAGGSNGGLLVGACMTQRPDLFKVALPAVGVLDMLRFHKFTIGAGWVVEYGSSDNENDFDNLYSYSPLHNLKEGTAYPATLITTGDHDDRVVPAHSFKFAARLQACQQGENPVLIRIETDAGHGAGKPTSKLLDELTDKWSFVMWNLGMTFQ
jgi:prolyl oligopeptidase